MRDSLYAGNKILANGGSALDAVVEAVRMMEGTSAIHFAYSTEQC